MNTRPKVLILDVDGVMTDGKFHYTTEGKIMKTFGADDNDALTLIDPFLEVQFISGDKRGFSISKRRIVDDMNRPLELVSTIKRIDWIKERYNKEEVIYMGDGIFDHYVFSEVGYAIAPGNADRFTRESADYVTERTGGDRAVAEAVIHILKTFFEPYDTTKLPEVKKKI
jgi:3-deoxy-D-manno-octulosonate 8-phosphate phosphatase (KDO 8-P phosphatase)